MIRGRVPVCAFFGAVVALAGSLCAPASAALPERASHFTTADGTIGFVLDLSGETPRQRFDSSPEILLLRPVAAARGDTIYRRSDGKIIIRSTPYGALTLYLPDSPGGLPVLRDGTAPALLPRNRSAEEVSLLGPSFERHLETDTRLAIHVESPPPNQLTTQTALNTLGDAIENAHIAVDRVANAVGTAEIAATLTTIRFAIAGKRGVDFGAKTLTVRFVPNLQFAGRPTSYEIAEKLRGAIAQRKAAESGLSAESSNAQEQHSFDFRW
ncbi:MAG TPA: DUF4908 domain-containing protein [Alphaproteobacteria bacterium]|nr:DUF4908 domain-containing protein [Alphaproteobacteria bacterium]